MAAPHARIAQQAKASTAAVDAALTLHSHASSTKKIYLDFDGFGLAAGTAWTNAIAAGTKGGFSLDGAANPGFSPDELTYITQVWTIVAEKYAPLDVDVTTQDPGDAALTRSSSSDTAYGTHVVFTDDANARPTNCPANGCAGIAWVGVFNIYPEATNDYEPAWVFTTLNFGSGDVHQTAGQAANSAAHETGHTLGLDHDVTNASPSGYYGGHDNWSPIMGSSNRAVQQFDNNGYPDAATPGQVDPNTNLADADDFDVMTKTGAPFRADTEGGSLGAHSNYTQDGVISLASDTDTFTVDRSSCTSDLTATATGIGLGQALDIQLTVSGPGGTFVDNPTSGANPGVPNLPTGMDATVTVPNAAAGTWSVKVEGTGDATNAYPDYGSRGQYHLTITGCAGVSNNPPSAPPTVSAVSGSSPGTVNVSWGVPDPGDSPITGYLVKASPGTVTKNVTAPATSTTLSGLTPGATYTITVAAKSALGTGAATGKSVKVAATIPTAPKIGTASSGATGGAVNAVARWSAPTSTGGSAITGYRVIAYKSTISGSVISATISKLLSTSARSYTFTLPAARYKFRVVAYNAVGRSPYSAYSGLVYAR